MPNTGLKQRSPLRRATATALLLVSAALTAATFAFAAEGLETKWLKVAAMLSWLIATLVGPRASRPSDLLHDRYLQLHLITSLAIILRAVSVE